MYVCFVCVTSDLAMSQVEKKAGLLRRTSSSKKPLKEKVVLMYDEVFAVSMMQRVLLYMGMMMGESMVEWTSIGRESLEG